MMRELSARHRVWLSDVWGVVHNGRAPVAATIEVMKKHREQGGLVVLITNAPRTAARVVVQMDGIGVDRDAYDAVVTSGDVTRDLIRKHGGSAVHFIGTEREMSLFEGQNVRLVGLNDAKAVVCAGLRNDATETVADYRDELQQLLARGLAMICANPDLVVRIGDKLRYCAGAIAAEYAKMGGKVLMAGKPYAPIYELAVETATKLSSRPLEKSEILAIGDGPDTDIKGAAAQNLPVVFLVAGIVEGHTPDEAMADIKHRFPTARVVHAATELSW